MYTVYKENKELFQVESVINNGDMWSFQDGDNENIIQKLATNDISQYIIKDDSGKIIEFNKSISLEEKNRADIDYIAIMTGVDL